MKRITVPALTKLARGQPCMVREPGVCNGNPETTVWAHSNQSRHGKGVGLKSHDPFGAFACSACHDFIDRRTHIRATEEQRRDAWERGYVETWKHLWSQGWVTVWTRG